MSSKMQSALLGALVFAVLGTLVAIMTVGDTSMQIVATISNCLVAIIAPLVAVWHYTSTNALTIPAGEGAGLGALASAVGALFGGIIGFLLQGIGLLPTTEEVIELQREQMLSQGMSAEQIDQTMGMMSTFSNPFIAILIGVVIGAIIGAIAGAISALIFKKGEEEELVI